MKVTVRVPGTCGELAQGIMTGINFHITCPINLYSCVTVKLNNSPEIRINQKKPRALQAAKETLNYFGVKNRGVQIDIQSELPVKKGMASSTADIAGVIAALSLALRKEVNFKLIKELALKVEPTDGCFLPGIAAFDHLKGQLWEQLGDITPLPILVFDSGGEVDTFEFNSREDLYNLKLAKEEEVVKAYKLIKQGIKEEDYRLIGRGATISSLANQTILKKPGLEKLINLVNNEEALVGVNAAHSGTVLGVIGKREESLADLPAKIEEKCPELNYLTSAKIVNGGYQVLKGEQYEFRSRRKCR